MMPRPKADWSDVMTVDQVAAYLQLNKLTIYHFIREGTLPASKVGKAYRVRKADVDWFLDSLRTRPVARRVKKPVSPKAAEALRREPVVVARRSEPAELRDRDLSVNPLAWVIRGLH